MVMAKSDIRIPKPAEIKALREALKLTQAEAAQRVGVAQPTWALWETGDRKPSRQSALLISLLLTPPDKKA